MTVKETVPLRNIWLRPRRMCFRCLAGRVQVCTLIIEDEGTSELDTVLFSGTCDWER